jgi:hypothetical protein
MNVAPSTAVAAYLDYRNWHRLFPLTIRAVKFIWKENNVLTVEVDHKTEGFVINTITVISSHEIKLEEFKPKYNATFINRFEEVSTGTLYTLVANVSMKNLYKLIEPFLKPVLKKGSGSLYFNQ